MCGIAGLWDYRKKIEEGLLESMRDTLVHRGPDDEGVFFDDGGRLGLASRRLAILDLSRAGHQPMQRGNLVVAYNGEIYNFEEIRRELEKLGETFSTDSDTEVLLAAFNKWGMDAVHKFRGMFAFSLWDKEKRTLLLCRDRVGVKPLYYYRDDDKFIFASEIKAILKHPKVNCEIDTNALANFLQIGHVPAPLSIYKKIQKLEPGSYLEVDKLGNIEKEKYWDITDYALSSRGEDLAPEEVLMRSEDILTESFKLRMVSDVDVGVFLSGGIDSSLVAALLSKDSNNKLNTFTIGFEEEKYNEAHYAKAVAEHLNTNHHELYLNMDKAMDIVFKLPGIYDEPYSAASAIPTYLVSEFARKDVTVALSADGADELFAGYGISYVWKSEAFDKYASLPRFAGTLARALENPITSSLFEKSVRLQMLAAQGDMSRTHPILHKKVFYDHEVVRLLNGEVQSDYSNVQRVKFKELEKFDSMSQLQLFDFKTQLVDDFLVKVDRASMAVSLEAREPFLDQKIIEYATSLPNSIKRRNGIDKYILREILYKYVPRELVDRPKKGFSMPIGQLLKKKKAELVDVYLEESKIKRENILNPEMVLEEKEKFFSGKVHGRGLWRLIVFQMWKEHSEGS